MKDINIGKLIQEKFEERKAADRTLTVTEFARRINISRSAVYLLFKQKSIDIELLINISKVLDYNFIEEVYLKHPQAKTNSIIVGIEIPLDQLQKLDLPEGFKFLFEDKK